MGSETLRYGVTPSWCARRSTSWSSGTGGSKNCARRIIETIHSAMVVLELGSHRARYNSSFASSCLLVDQYSRLMAARSWAYISQFLIRCNAVASLQTTSSWVRPAAANRC
ncbi:4-hydroxy-tetrahydrodipicolinate synthase [Frankliniella fusca]|uniref:4-hydroxy-tetrahydrodipicolinate synthase n=1 Tax=Frankliniella fusca TaxID=407009 RepID=A0AAE1HN23_9NEOP|nr:4-hydroxy-tetrahydrodipicolinate synthase [Frankliniella fusca]